VSGRPMAFEPTLTPCLRPDLMLCILFFQRFPGRSQSSSSRPFGMSGMRLPGKKAPSNVSLEQAEVVLSWLEALDRKDLKIIEVGCGAGWLCSR
jgi:hypothetical protein